MTRVNEIISNLFINDATLRVNDVVSMIVIEIAIVTHAINVMLTYC